MGRWSLQQEDYCDDSGCTTCLRSGIQGKSANRSGSLDMSLLADYLGLHPLSAAFGSRSTQAKSFTHLMYNQAGSLSCGMRLSRIVVIHQSVSRFINGGLGQEDVFFAVQATRGALLVWLQELKGYLMDGEN
jgi:hypothetical protein